MTLAVILRASVGLLPVLSFLAVLLYLDSYKLVRLRTVILVILVGALAAGASFGINGLAVQFLEIEFSFLSRYVAPVIEELLKVLVIVWMVHHHRIGFLVDAAIFGFAVGVGFAMIENIFYLWIFPDAAIGTWIVRGFGTAVMHGGATAIFAIIAIVMIERGKTRGLDPYLPGFIAAVILHSLYNHFFFTPVVSAIGVLIILPLLFVAAFETSERALRNWLGSNFDVDTEMLELINSGEFSNSPVGLYLHKLKDRFHGPVVADLLCYLRLHTELAIRAKGILMMRDAGFDATLEEETRAKFAEMRYLENSIGHTGRLALQPVLHNDRRELWQLYFLDQ